MSQLNLCCIDVNKSLRHLYIITIKFIASLETNKFVNSNCEKILKIISYITNFVILKFVPSIVIEILICYVNFCVSVSK
jgi:hypothetical protein